MGEGGGGVGPLIYSLVPTSFYLILFFLFCSSFSLSFPFPFFPSFFFFLSFSSIFFHPSCFDGGPDSRSLMPRISRLTFISSYFAGDHHPHVDLAEWFIKQEEEYGIPQSFFQVVAADYENATLNKEHRKRTPKNNATVICEECGKSFSRLDSLRRHEKQYCRIKGERVFCRFCGKKFVRAMSLLAHMQSVHAGKLPESDSLGQL